MEKKIWLSANDDATRDSHRDAGIYYADNPVALNEPFEIDGENLMYPGDPNGSPGNVINCRCSKVPVVEE